MQGPHELTALTNKSKFIQNKIRLLVDYCVPFYAMNLQSSVNTHASQILWKNGVMYYSQTKTDRWMDTYTHVHAFTYFLLEKLNCGKKYSRYPAIPPRETIVSRQQLIVKLAMFIVSLPTCGSQCRVSKDVHLPNTNSFMLIPNIGAFSVCQFLLL